MTAVLDINPAGTLQAVLSRVTQRVAPVWPLQDFVAVNPFHGLAEQRFEQAVATLGRVGGLTLLPGAPARAAADCALTVADVLDRTQGTHWARTVTEEIGKWCAAWADEGQASWAMPWHDQPLFPAWRAAMRFDRMPAVLGLKQFGQHVAALPAEPAAAIAAVLAALGLTAPAAEDYLHRALLSVGGWAAFFRGKAFPQELAGEPGETVLHLLAVRLAWDHALHAAHADAAFRGAWAARLAALPPAEPDLAPALGALKMKERAHQARLAAALAAPKQALPRPAVQAAFCIDVRSEVFRRHLEDVAPQAATIGFAGFFGFSLEYVKFGDRTGSAQCPVLLRPGFTVCEAVPGAGEAETQALLTQTGWRRRVADTWAAFKGAAVSCFAYVETAGPLAAMKLVKGTLRAPPPAPQPALAPDITPRSWQGRQMGLAAQQRVDTAEFVLKAMSLTSGFAPLVLLCGHGATTVNNPHAAALDCGACGGHTGESNARVAAAVLNDPAVRQGLAARGIEVPADTWFLAGLHDTVLDAVTIYDTEAVPAANQRALAALEKWLAEAGRRTRAERAVALGAEGEALPARARDWSEVRPEWALAGNAAFIAAPRTRTLGADLSGRAFLHSYDWRQDSGFGVLELIMTAPMVVAGWINLQYYGSTTAPEAFGSGNKLLHNVVGRFGVLEGQGGDLRVGLPRQSVHDGISPMHEPLRLSVLIEAPEAAMEAVLAKHEHVRHLVQHGWLYLCSIQGEGAALRRYVAPGVWEAVSPA